LIALLAIRNLRASRLFMEMRQMTTASTQAQTLPAQSFYLSVLTWSFTLFNLGRTIAYVPTMWAVLISGDSTQHSLLTWCTWVGANITMTCWLFEQAGRRVDRAVLLNLCNTTMCMATLVIIGAQRV
jgi:hypothetical protein